MSKGTIWIYLKIFDTIIIVSQKEKKIFDDHYVIGGVVENWLKIAIFGKKKNHIFNKKYKSEFSMQGYDSNVFFSFMHLIPSPKFFLHMYTHKAHFWTHMYFFTDSKNSKFNQILYNLRLRLLRACFATFFFCKTWEK